MDAAPRSLWHMTGPRIPVDDALPPTADVLVAGAGLAGLATALVLARSGRRVVVAEARAVGAVTTGHTTGKLSLLQGTVLSRMREHGGDAAIAAYLAANRAAQQWLLQTVGEDPQTARSATAYTYANGAAGAEALEREAAAMAEAGAPVRTTADPGLPFPVAGAIALPGQWRLHPIRVLARLTEQFRELGGVVVDDCRVTDADVARSDLTVTTTRGVVRCDRLVLATGVPALDRSFFFAAVTPSRSLVGAYSLPDLHALPVGMFVAADEPSHSLRTAEGPDGSELLLVGSPSFTPGRGTSTAALLADLDAWTVSAFPGAQRVTWWAAQDYRPAAGAPFAAQLPGFGGLVSAATGFDKWGMTNAVAAALTLAGELGGDALDRIDTSPSRTARDVLAANAAVAARLFAGWTRAQAPIRARAGEAAVGRDGIRPVAQSTVDGRTCRLSAVCTHLGGIVQWNDAERSWDCPLHGSRFAPDGTVLEGPAVRPLADAGGE